MGYNCLLALIFAESYRRRGGVAFRVHAAAGRGEGWGWHQVGKGSGPGEVQQPGDLLPVDGARNLEDTQDIHHHLLGVRVLGSGHSFQDSVSQTVHATGISDTLTVHATGISNTQQ